MADRRQKDGLRDLRKIVMKPIQMRHITHAYTAQDHAAIEEADWMTDLGFSTLADQLSPRGYSCFTEYCWNRRLSEEKCRKITLDLTTDILLPTPWQPERILNNLGRIVKTEGGREFCQDSNHHVVWLTPLDIGWVVSGNHSIAQAIIAGEGHIVPREAYDITNLLSDIYFDGKYWKHSSGDSLGHMPRYEELGWAWEISRMISMLD